MFPTRDAPQGVTGQVCADGRFTTLLVYDIDGVDGAALVPVVGRLLTVMPGRA